MPPGSLTRREYDDAPQFAANVVVCGESASMLRVITERQGDRYRLDLHGTLGGEWVVVLDQHWRSIMADVPSAKLTLVLSNVDFIDPDGEQLLHRTSGRFCSGFSTAGSACTCSHGRTPAWRR